MYKNTNCFHLAVPCGDLETAKKDLFINAIKKFDVNPTNQVSVFLLVVPVFPAIFSLRSLSFLPVPLDLPISFNGGRE